MSGLLTEVEGLTVGHYTDESARTGCTAILCGKGAVAGVDVRGSAPGTRETDLLSGCNAVERINAVMLSGGSAFGLDAASGAMQYLEEQGRGVDVGVGVVPIVPAAVIFDLTAGSAQVRPGKAEGYAACLAAAKQYALGRVGAGCGATVGKAFGMEHCMPGGLGSSALKLQNGVTVAALVVVNALGNIYDPDTGKIVAGANRDGAFLECTADSVSGAGFGNTTIGVVATDAALTREQANKLASMAHDGLAMSIRPVHTTLDGDTMFALSLGDKQCELLPLLVAAARVTALAVLNAVGCDKG